MHFFYLNFYSFLVILSFKALLFVKISLYGFFHLDWCQCNGQQLIFDTPYEQV